MAQLILTQATTLDCLAKQVDSHALLSEQGSNRVQHLPCQIHAKNDYEAIYAWLSEYQQQPATYRLYRKEAERLLLWCLISKHCSLSSLNRADLAEYERFLQNPSPKKVWCAPKGARRGSAKWRPFVGPLSQSAVNTAMTVLQSLFDYLVKADYLNRNPLVLRKAKSHANLTSANRAFQVSARILSDDEWQALLATLESQPEENEKQQFYKYRLRLIVHALFFLGLRVSELTQLTWQSFRLISDNWWVYVIGKGNKPGKVPVHGHLLETIAEYRIFNKLSPLPQADEHKPVIVNWHQRSAMTPRGVNGLLKALALATSKHFVAEPSKAKKLEKFSAHWLRHLSASMQDRAGIKFGHIRANLRHENDETTRIYVHAEDIERFEAIQKLGLISDSQF